ncbi:MAG TPA: glycosyltransferase family 2 protein [Saprospiraceae bacterium]|nr:glycosyltransferase family 2 protein [Saprospiraceae bacterium]HNT19188.1 glycosyltransferase family 2 protein [Saprospiraceae bacterium]
MNKLSVLVPVYNEEKTIGRILDKLREVQLIGGLAMEVIVVNDKSTDHTQEVILGYLEKNNPDNIFYYSHEKNAGKGAALHTGIAKATGDFITIQDADLEYDPQEFNLLLAPMVRGHADVVYGSRFIGGRPHRLLFFWHTLGNKFLTFLSNLFNNMNFTDMETCYKMFRREVLQSLKLKEKRFGFEPEVTAKISKIQGIRIYEVGISYYGRTYEEGKKINWKDGLKAIYCIFKYKFFD